MRNVDEMTADCVETHLWGFLAEEEKEYKEASRASRVFRFAGVGVGVRVGVRNL